MFESFFKSKTDGDAGHHGIDLNIPLYVLRFLFLFVAGTLGIVIVKQTYPQQAWGGNHYLILLSVIGVAGLAVFIDLAIRRKRIDTISALYFGVIIGLTLTYVAGFAISPFLDMISPFNRMAPANQEMTRAHVQLVMGLVLCYVCITVLLQTKHDFRFIIPYVEFAKEVKGARPYVLDTSSIIDGRIIDVVGTGVLSHQIIVPRFILTELQNIADSADRMRRSRGRRGLDMLNKLRNMDKVDLQIYDREHAEFRGQPVDLQLVMLGKQLGGQIITNDYNLNKVAKLHDVTVINLNDIANALKPVFLPGEQLNVKAVKAGEEQHQAVGYLDDGTMVVIEGGRDHIGKNVHLAVTSVLQTSAGRMIFGKFEYEVGKQAEKSA